MKTLGDFVKLVLALLLLILSALFSCYLVSRSVSFGPRLLTPLIDLAPGSPWPAWLTCDYSLNRYEHQGLYCSTYRDTDHLFVMSEDGKTVSHVSLFYPDLVLGDLEAQWGEPDLARYGSWSVEVSWGGTKSAYASSADPWAKVWLVSYDLQGSPYFTTKWRGHVDVR